MTAMYWVAVALGGAVGAMGRAFLATQLPSVAGFPLHTFAVNVVGSAVIGVIWALFSRMDAHVAWSAFLMTGVLGGFTTFSSFSLETVQLAQQGQWMTAGLYVVASVSLCVAAAGLGILSVRAFS